ncbi:MAG: hypothetical protein IJU93_03045 [Lachnospiraceae bacterium]|nr:hypothetical protein [Lachnospiraceae bacterium]
MKKLKDSLELGGISLCTTLAFVLDMSKNVYAYVDPSVMSYTIQAVAGIIIAAGAAVGIIWRKAKKKVNTKLGLDENKNKEVETDDIIVNTEAKKEE